MSHPFTYDHYIRILAAGKAAGYEFALFRDGPEAGGRQIFLRHDIDNDVSIAHRMARIEHEQGARATYLVMLRSANYNAAEGRNLRMIADIAGMGHDIGLHFSLVDHPERDRERDLVTLIRRDADFLRGLVGQDIRVFGFHNPTEGGQYRVEAPGLINTYGAHFFDQAYYLSESNMRWAKGCPCETLGRCGADRVQLLVHPLSFDADLASDRDVLVHFLHLKLADLVEYNAGQNRNLRQQNIGLHDLLHDFREKGPAK